MKKPSKKIKKIVKKSSKSVKSVKKEKPTTGQSGPKIELLPWEMMNEKEQKLVKAMKASSKDLTLEELAKKCFPSKKAAQGNSWVRNSLRRLVRAGLVRKVEEGRYKFGAKKVQHVDLEKLAAKKEEERKAKAKAARLAAKKAGKKAGKKASKKTSKKTGKGASKKASAKKVAKPKKAAKKEAPKAKSKARSSKPKGNPGYKDALGDVSPKSVPTKPVSYGYMNGAEMAQ